MKTRLFRKSEHLPEDGVFGTRKPRNRVLLSIICFCSLAVLTVFWQPWLRMGSAVNQDSLPPPKKDDVFGVTCPPGLCGIPQGFLLSNRDKAFAVHFSDDKNGWVVGDSGLMLKTSDGGKSWERIMISVESTFNDVYFVGKKGWVVGAGGVVFCTRDGGKTWKKQDSTVRKSLMKVHFLDENKGIAVGADGTILISMNGGSQWEDVSLDCMEFLPMEIVEVGIVSLNLYDIVFTDANSGWIVGDSGAILHSKDGGRKWELTHIGLYPPLFSIAFLNAREAWAVGQNGFSLKTQDGGSSWEKVAIEKKNSLYKIRFFKDYGVIVGDQATIIETNDGGKTWDKVAIDLDPPYPWLASACILPSNSAKILSIGKGVILDTKIVSKK